MNSQLRGGPWRDGPMSTSVRKKGPWCLGTTSPTSLLSRLAAFWVFRAQSLPPPGSDLRTLGSAAAGEAPFLSLKVTIKPALSVKIQSGKWKHLQGLKAQGTGFTGVRPTRDCEAAERVALAGSHQHLQAGRQQGQREWMAGDPVGAGPSR